jgi:hypothetical protein
MKDESYDSARSSKKHEGHSAIEMRDESISSSKESIKIPQKDEGEGSLADITDHVSKGTRAKKARDLDEEDMVQYKSRQKTPKNEKKVLKFEGGS